MAVMTARINAPMNGGGAPDTPLEWGVAELTLPGQTQSGDRFVLKLFDGGALAGVIDGLGHGDEAAAAAVAAATILEAHPHEPVATLVSRCHQQLQRTRGAVMSLASFDARENTLTWIAVGNVEGVLHYSHGTP